MPNVKEFSKKVGGGNAQQYGISSTFAEFILEKKFDAIVYPSVQANMKGFNIVMNPQIADSYLKLERIIVADLYQFKKHRKLYQVLNCDLKNGYPFYWENVPKEINPDIETIIMEFEFDNIQPNEIISALINQIKRY